MTDLAHTYGQDLQLSPTGGLALSDGTQLGQERVLRRLLTATRGYLWDLTYGAGLPAMVGTPANAQRIAAIARAQMLQEAAVARSPAPSVAVDARPDGTVSMRVRYADAQTADAVQTLAFSVQ